MAATFVQSRGASGQSGPVSFAYTSPLTSGNSAIVCLGYASNGVVATTVVDNLGNTFSLIKRSDAVSQGVTDIWVSQGVVAGSSTVTVTFSSGKSGIGICLLEYAPTAGQVFTLNQQNENGGLAQTSYPSGSITTTDTSELVLYVGRINNQTSVPAGFTTRNNLVGSNSVTVFEKITSIVEALNPIPTGPSTNYRAMIASFSDTPDNSGIRYTQEARLVLYDEDEPGINLTQMARQVLYPFACSGPAAPDTRVFLFKRNTWGIERFDIKVRQEDKS